MLANIAFYVHHHGSGHVMRAIAISESLQDCSITFLGSDLQRYHHIIPGYIKCLHLPKDLPSLNDVHFEARNPVDCLHYAPLNIQGVRERNRMMTEFFSNTFPLLLIVDVSVEVTLLARLCGIPTVVVRQHGNRTDLPHLSAYQSASALLAPYPAWMQQPGENWLREKTIFTGGFSRYQRIGKKLTTEQTSNVTILTGSGGTSIDLTFVRHIAGLCTSWTFNVIGSPKSDFDTLPANVIMHGYIDDPLMILQQTSIVIGNAGHNTVMEMAALNKRFIVIPEVRPFNEQQEKADLLEKYNQVYVVKPGALYTTDWSRILSLQAKQATSWRDTIDLNALHIAANTIKTVYDHHFAAGVNRMPSQ
jgi:predicted glycosyltransferase